MKPETADLLEKLEEERIERLKIEEKLKSAQARMMKFENWDIILSIKIQQLMSIGII